MFTKKEQKNTRHRRIRKRIIGTNKIPRLCVFRSNRHIYAQLIDDEKEKTLAMASDLEIKKQKIKKSEIASKVGELIAKKAKDLPAGRQVERVIFDRAGYKYHGRVKSLADSARKAGLKF